MLTVKTGVRPWSLVIAAAVANVAAEYDVTLTITAGEDGEHMLGSKHYTGEALDVRRRNLSDQTLRQVVSRLAVRLGPDYDIVLEADHIHIERDPAQ